MGGRARSVCTPELAGAPGVLLVGGWGRLVALGQCAKQGHPEQNVKCTRAQPRSGVRAGSALSRSRQLHITTGLKPLNCHPTFASRLCKCQLSGLFFKIACSWVSTKVPELGGGQGTTRTLAWGALPRPPLCLLAAQGRWWPSAGLLGQTPGKVLGTPLDGWQTAWHPTDVPPVDTSLQARDWGLPLDRAPLAVPKRSLF